jgi:CBS domain-containing protein
MSVHATLPPGALDEIPVEQAMHPGVLTCPPETPLRDVARMMARYRIHAVVAFSEDEEGERLPELWGVISDSDLVAAAAAGDVDERTAGGTARTSAVTVSGTTALGQAAELMTHHGVTHLVVLSPETHRPVGILSTLDVAAALAGEPGSGR